MGQKIEVMGEIDEVPFSEEFVDSLFRIFLD